jgi:hypothetical protein
VFIYSRSRLGTLAYRRAITAQQLDLFRLANLQEPDKIKIYYRAGMQDTRQEYPNLRMDTALERMIVYFALCLLDTRMHGCTNTMNIWEEMTENLAVSTRERQHILPWDLTNNPFGTKKAAIDLYKYAFHLRLGKPVR